MTKITSLATYSVTCQKATERVTEFFNILLTLFYFAPNSAVKQQAEWLFPATLANSILMPSFNALILY